MVKIMNKDEVVEKFASNEEMCLLKDEILGCPHNIVEIDGRLRWEEEDGFSENIPSLNDLISSMMNRGISKNNEAFRNLYRKMGVSLYLYWEVFYWEMNNEDAENYVYKKEDK